MVVGQDTHAAGEIVDFANQVVEYLGEFKTRRLKTRGLVCICNRIEHLFTFSEGMEASYRSLLQQNNLQSSLAYKTFGEALEGLTAAEVQEMAVKIKTSAYEGCKEEVDRLRAYFDRVGEAATQHLRKPFA
ncbi:MAG: hypothetical protein AABX71_00725 [Nanoarchaeota archaeon]